MNPSSPLLERSRVSRAERSRRAMILSSLLGFALLGSACASWTVPLSVETDPVGATVYIDGKPVGQTPYRSKVEFKTHDDTRLVVIKKPKYQDATREIRYEDEGTTLYVELVPNVRRVDDE